MTERPTLQSVLGTIPDVSCVRYPTLDFRQRCQNKLQTAGMEAKIAQTASQWLLRLREDPTIYARYARGDILEGLAAIDHPQTQLVIARDGLQDPDQFVSERASRLLHNPMLKIHPQILEYLINQDVRGKELTMTILETNETIGTESNPLSRNLEEELSRLLMQREEVRENSEILRIALVIARMNKKSPVAAYLKETAILRLYQWLNGTITQFKIVEFAQRVFESLVHEIVAVNAGAARADLISQIPLAMPEVLKKANKVAEALVSFQDPHSTTLLDEYLALVALAKSRAREELAARLAKEQQESVTHRLAMETEAKRLAQLREADRRLQLLREREVREREATAEQELLGRVKIMFPHL